MLFTLKKYFGFKSFRPGQEEIINAILANESVLAILPTGGGKSLCYQIPSLLCENFAIVISPLIALMKDQVDSLNKKEQVAEFINSSLDYYETEMILNSLSERKIKLLYVAPERLENKTFAERIKNLKPSFIFVDEAHCISEWGHNFRPSYRKIKEFIEYTQVKTVSAFTATATPEVEKDIVLQLGMKHPKIFVKGFERDNLFINVLQVKNKFEKIIELLNRFGLPAIIYTATRKSAEDISRHLLNNKIDNSFYHAGISNIQRKKIQENFIQDKIGVIVATNAFGMGIDKKDIRIVIHFNMPGSIENFYQEIGRAGRDSKNSYTYMLFDKADINIQQYFINSSFPDKELIRSVYDAICNLGQVAINNLSTSEIPIKIDFISVFAKRDISKGLL
jgi:ATP-dependent DNA helicase RecQ